MICSVAPAKIILFGEHFVVKNYPAIATAVNLYSKTCIYEYDQPIVESKQLGVKTILGVEDVDQKFKQFNVAYEMIKTISGAVEGFYAVIDSEIPVSAGMGSSASTIVSFIHSLLTYYGLKPDLDLVNKIAYEAEKIVHKKPSGIDNTIVTYGGTIYYRSGSMERLNIDWPNDLYIVAIDTGVKRDTGMVVRSVLDLYDKYPNILGKVYEAAGLLVDTAREYLLNKRFMELGDLININHGLLVSLGLSTIEVEEAINMLKKIGAIGAKMSGAGRGGIVYGLFMGDPHKVRSMVGFAGKIYLLKPINEGVKSIYQ